MATDREQLEQAIDEAVDDAARYAVLGDWLAQTGDPRGELIALQLDAGRKTKAKREREEALLLTRGIRVAQPQRAQWRWGFVHTLLFELVHFAQWEEHLDDWPQALLEPQLRHPSCRFLRALVVDGSPGDRALEYLSQQLPRHVGALTLICNELDLARARGALGRLTRLQVSAQLITPARLALPGLRELALPLDALSDAGLRLTLESLPALEKLTLSSLGTIERAAVEALAVAPLTSLTLRAEQTSRGAIDALCDSPLRESLVSLDVSRSGLSEEAARRLLARASAFAKLSDLVLGDAVE
ncbi:MAG: hypothetical protein ACOZQL_01905 [Myxococcota bacterium]